MRIVLINPRVTTTPNYPMGIMYLASVLEQDGHKVRLIDSMASDKEIVESIEADLVGITVTTPQMPRALKLSKMIKDVLKVPVVMGGVHPTIRPEDVLVEPTVDYVVIGEGEETFPELVKKIESKEKDLSSVMGIGYRVDGKHHITAPRPMVKDLDSIPYPAYHLLGNDIYYRPPRIRGTWTKRTAYLMASRGCPYRCAFCSGHLMFGNVVRRRSVKNVLGEIDMLVKIKNIDAVGFLDDTFTADPEWVKEFCKKKNPNIKWTCQARVNTLMDEEMLALMKKSGCCQVDIGVESGSQKILNILKKGITPEMTRKAFKRLHRAGIKTFVSLIVGVPGETKEDIESTIRLLKEIRPDFADVFILTPYPGTDFDTNTKDWGKFIMNKHAKEQAGDLNDMAIEHRKMLLKHTGGWLKMASPRSILPIGKMAFSGRSGWKGGMHKMLGEHRRKLFQYI